jgi:hypothetical protein
MVGRSVGRSADGRWKGGWWVKREGRCCHQAACFKKDEVRQRLQGDRFVFAMVSPQPCVVSSAWSQACRLKPSASEFGFWLLVIHVILTFFRPTHICDINGPNTLNLIAPRIPPDRKGESGERLPGGCYLSP